MSTDVRAWLETALPRQLPAFLPAQRWFAGKARTIHTVTVEDAAWLAGDTRQPCALVIAGVTYADGGRERYALLLALIDDERHLPVVGRVDRASAPSWIVEAATDAGTGLALVRGFISGEDRPTLLGGRLLYADITASAAEAVARHGTIRALGAEQSNTSIVIDRALVFKIFRKLDDGENPELEMSRFLSTRTTFRGMPALHGSLTYASPRGTSSTVGVLQQWVDNRGDGWSYVLEQLRQFVGGVNHAALADDLRTLGAITADFHAALATGADEPAFAPEKVTAKDVEHWQAARREQTARSLALVERSVAGWPTAARRLGESLLALRDSTSLAAAPAIEAASAQFHKIRVHGDYHLGQTLKTDDAFVLIDLEGEPARPLAERRLKQCALKDVAGMIRSFDYAVETVRAARPDRSSDVMPAAGLRDAFLDGYLASATEHDAIFLPEDRGVLDAWIEFFEVEKALYELEYEINNRPAWVHIPLGGIRRILKAA